MGSWASKHKLFLSFQVYHTTKKGRYSKNPFSDSKKDKCSSKAGELQSKCTFQIQRRPLMAFFKNRQQEKDVPVRKKNFEYNVLFADWIVPIPIPFIRWTSSHTSVQKLLDWIVPLPIPFMQMEACLYTDGKPSHPSRVAGNSPVSFQLSARRPNWYSHYLAQGSRSLATSCTPHMGATHCEDCHNNFSMLPLDDSPMNIIILIDAILSD